MVDFTIVVLEQAWASGVSLSLDVLSTAAIMSRQATPRWRVASPSGGLVRLGNGMGLLTGKLPGQRAKDRSTWIVPGLGTGTAEAITKRIAQPDAAAAARAIGAHLRRGGSIAASCSAVFLLQAAGVLEGRTVTTSWWLAPHLRRLGGAVNIDAGRIIVADGPILTAGAALAHTDLMLALLRKKFGARLAETVSRVLLIDGRAAQSAYVIPYVLAGGDELIARLSKRIENAMPQVPSVRELAREFGMSERTLARHVFAATGISPLALIQNVRLSRARALLEKSRLPVADVASQVGYADATALLRLMKRVLGATPRQLRLGRHRAR